MVAKRKAIKGAQSSGATSLEGYLYQLDVSVWAALDLLIAKRLAAELVLEPASQEDLEAELGEEEQGVVASSVAVGGYRLVVQAKLRNTGPWKVTGLKKLLEHGTKREPAIKRLKDSQIKYVLVTNADLDGEARGARVAGFGQWPKASEMPKRIASLLPAGGADRLGVLSNADAEKIAWRLRGLLEDSFRVPHAKFEECAEALRREALLRMRGAGNGAWKREEVEAIIQAHDGYLAASLESETFVPPTNWKDLQAAVRQHNAVIIAGPSGTGKTTAARVLMDGLRAETPGLTPITIIHGPQQVRANQTTGPVAFTIEDPWGRYRVEPQSQPWNDELGSLLSTVSPNRRFIITSRSDVLAESKGRKKLAGKWFVTLEAENYGQNERLRLFEQRVPSLPRHLQEVCVRYRGRVLDRLSSPLEIQKFFDQFAEGPSDGEEEAAFVQRCLESADADAVDRTLLQQVAIRDAWQWAAITWGLLKARPTQSRMMLPAIQGELARAGREFEDGLEAFINILVSGRNLRQVDAVLSYYHPRVEAGLLAATREHPNLSKRVLGHLVDALAAIDGNGGDWGRESAATLVQAAKADGVAVNISAPSQIALDAWIAQKLSTSSDEFAEALQLAANVGSASSQPADLARWLLNVVPKHDFFMERWSPEPDTDGWYAAMAKHPQTAEICAAFISRVLPHERDVYPEDFSSYTARLSDALTPIYLDTARSMVTYGYNWSAEAIANGALHDLAGFDAVAQAALQYQEKRRHEDDESLWLAVRNGEYSEDHVEHLGEAHYEEGHTADVFVKAFVRELRAKRGWTSLRDHPKAPDLLYAWIDVLKGVRFEAAEIEALSTAVRGHREESRFWALVTKTWRNELLPDLRERLADGHADGGVRANVAYCAVRHGAEGLFAAVADALIQRSDHRRLIELLVDMRALAKDDEEDKAQLDLCTQTLIGALPEPLRLAAEAVRDQADASPTVDHRAVEVLRTIEPGTNATLRLARAKLLAQAGLSCSDDIDLLLATKQDDEGDVDAAAEAIRVCARLGLWAKVEENLTHRFADVRQECLELLAGRTSGRLPDRLLSLANDKGSRVRRALLKFLEARRDAGHASALATLAADEWTSQGVYYGEDVSYPIAVQAAKILGEPPQIPAHLLKGLLKIAQKTADEDVRDHLLDALAKNGSREGLTLVLDLALARGTPKLHSAASRSLYRCADVVDEDAAARLTVAELSRRAAPIAVPMTLVVGQCAGEDQILATAQALAGVAHRRALLVPLMIAASADEAVVQQVSALLPADLVQALMGGVKLRRNALDDLGDVRTVTEIRDWFPHIFEPEPKQATTQAD